MNEGWKETDWVKETWRKSAQTSTASSGPVRDACLLAEQSGARGTGRREGRRKGSSGGQRATGGQLLQTILRISHLQ